MSSAIKADFENGSAGKIPVAAIREFLTVSDNSTDAISAEKKVPKTIVKRRHTFSGGKKRVSFDLNLNETFFFPRDDTSRYSELADASATNNDKKNGDDQITDKKLPSANVTSNELNDAEASADSSNGERVAPTHSIDSPYALVDLVETNDKQSDEKISDEMSSDAANSCQSLEYNDNSAVQCGVLNGPSCCNKQKKTKGDSIENDSSDVRDSDNDHGQSSFDS